jgi:hypothetical protein
MKKRFMLPIVAVALFGLVAAFATTAQATPAQSTVCDACHTLDSTVTISATPGANNGTTATYNIAVTTPFAMQGWAVFNGFTKVAGSSGSTGTVVLPVGKTYTVFGAGGTFVGDGSGVHLYNSTSITPPLTWRTVNIKVAKVKGGPKAPAALLTSKANGKKYKGAISKKSGWFWAKFRVPLGSYKLTVTAKKFKFKPRTVVVK